MIEDYQDKRKKKMATGDGALLQFIVSWKKCAWLLEKWKPNVLLGQ